MNAKLPVVFDIVEEYIIARMTMRYLPRKQYKLMFNRIKSYQDIERKRMSSIVMTRAQKKKS